MTRKQPLRMARQEHRPIPVNILLVLNRLKSVGTARLLPTRRRHSSAGASPSRPMKWLVKVVLKIFKGRASFNKNRPRVKIAVPKKIIN